MTEKYIRGSGSSNKEEMGTESPKVKLRLKISCATTLWKLARGSLLNSSKITETKALLVLAKIIEKETGKLQINCLILVMELAAMVECNPDLKRTAFKPNSPAAKAVLDHLLRVINKETSAPLVIPSIKDIGCLAPMFFAKEKWIVKHLIAQHGNTNLDVGAESAKALGKFVCKDNYNCVEHCKAIVEFDGVPKLMNLIRRDNREESGLDEIILLWGKLHPTTL